jgi:DNA-binding NarL/FixJ family response regulator
MKILIVEDQLPTLLYLNQLCKEIYTNAEITCLSHFDKSLAALKSIVFDLVITDLDFDGAKRFAIVELARDLQINCIVYTAFYKPTIVKKALALSVNAYVCKFGDIEDLKLVIRSHNNLKQHVCGYILSQTGDKIILDVQELILTPTENKLIEFLVMGIDRKVIAQRLKIKQATLNSYIKQIKQKNALSLAEVVRNYVYWNSI